MAARPPQVLVVTDRERPEESFVRGVIGSLRSRARIVLAAPDAVPLEAVSGIVEDNPDLAMIVLIGFDNRTDGIITSLRSIRPTLKFASLPVIGVHISVNLPDPSRIGLAAVFDRPVLLSKLDVALPSPNSPEFAEIIDLLLNGPERREPARGEIVHLRPPGPAQVAPAKHEPADQAVIASLLDKALKWVEAAVQALREIWSEDGEIQPMRPVSLSWLEWLLGIENAPCEAAERAFRDFLAELEQPAAAATPLHRIATLLDHHEIALKLLLVVLSPELDVRFQRIFGAMHDDFGRRYPSITLACALVATATPKARPVDIRLTISRFDELRAYGIINGIGSPSLAAADGALSVEPTVLDWIFTGDAQTLLREPAFSALLVEAPEAVNHLYPPDRAGFVMAASSRTLSAPHGAVLLTGSEPGWIQADADILVEGEVRIVPREGGESAIGKLLQALRLAGRPIIVDLTRGDAAAMAHWQALLPHLVPRDPPPLILTQEPAALLAAAPRASLAVVHLPEVTLLERAEAISRLTLANDPELAGELARQFKLPFDHLPDALSLAMAEADKAEHRIPDAEDWRAGFRAAAGAHLPGLARRVAPQVLPDALQLVVLPEVQAAQLRAIVAHVRFGHIVLDDWEFGRRLQARGVSAMFSGESGTGKTLAAHAIASALGADLYVVDLARIVSKYIGETEKNLDIVFGEAERAGAVLLFDEADALFGKRSEVKDAHDRYANIEVAYLLQRIELFDGLAILTTNHPETVDPAFTRRLRFGIEFPRPDAKARARIWDIAIPSEFREPADLDLSFFARRLELTGGTIRQIAIHAAISAAEDGTWITKDHILAATRDQLLRMGAHGQLSQLERAA